MSKERLYWGDAVDGGKGKKVELGVRRLSMELRAITNFIPGGTELTSVNSSRTCLPYILTTHSIIDCTLTNRIIGNPFRSTTRRVGASKINSHIDTELNSNVSMVRAASSVGIIAVYKVNKSLVSGVLRGNELGSGLINIRQLVLRPGGKRGGLHR